MAYVAYYLNPEGQLVSNLQEEQIVAAVESGRGMLWVDICETSEEESKFLERVFHFHHLAIEDCLSMTIHPPKIDDFGNYLFIIVHGINHAAESDIVETAELAIFLGENFVVSNHNFPLYSVQAVKLSIEANSRYMQRGSDFFVHALADALVDNVLPTIDKMSETAEEIEEQSIRDPQQSTLDAILRLKRSALVIYRIMSLQREVFNRLSRGEFPIIKAETQIFFRDVYDHVARIEGLNDTIRDRADNALTTYLSSIANRQNETMKTLAIVATIFMPLTLLAGIYGMNFEYMPELTWKWAYFAVLGVMGIAIGSIIWRFWAKGWFAWGRKRVSRISFAADPRRLVGHREHNGIRRHHNS